MDNWNHFRQVMFREKPRDWFVPELDGLRAIAVLAVLLFHLSVPWAKQGYLGVDVFMVLSGYLVCSRTTGELLRNEFTVSRFWIKRIRRLAPAALTAILLTTIASSALDPAPLPQTVTEQALWAAIGLANFHFPMHFGDYWGSLAHEQPLLHTWSLAVEEQFYLAWPLLLIATKSASTRARVGLIASITAISLCLFLSLAAENWKISFYMAPCRAWQFGLGALIPYIHDKYVKLGATVTLITAISIGLAPGDQYGQALAHLQAGLATVALLLHIDGGGQVALLRLRLFTSVGIRSYSLYLVHWPAIVFFSRSSSADDVTWALLPAIAFLTQLNFLVERRSRAIPGGPWGVIATASAGLFIMCSTPKAQSKYPFAEPTYRGWELGAAPDTGQIRSILEKGRAFGVNLDGSYPLTPQKPRKAMLIGDSLAGMLAIQLDKILARNNIKLERWFADGCDPSDGIVPGPIRKGPGFSNEEYLEFVSMRNQRLRSGEIEGVVLVSLQGNSQHSLRMQSLAQEALEHCEWMLIIDSLPLPEIPHGASMHSALAKRGITDPNYSVSERDCSRSFGLFTHASPKVHRVFLSECLRSSSGVHAVRDASVLWLDNHHLTEEGVSTCSDLLRASVTAAVTGTLLDRVLDSSD